MIEFRLGQYPEWLNQDFAAVPIPASLTDKQIKFAQCFALEGNASEAARQAGYAAESASLSGHKAKSIPDVDMYLSMIRKYMQERHKMTKYERESILSDIGRGKITGRDAELMIKAIGMLGKMEGDFTEKVDNTTRLVIDRREDTAESDSEKKLESKAKQVERIDVDDPNYERGSDEGVVITINRDE